MIVETESRARQPCEDPYGKPNTRGGFRKAPTGDGRLSVKAPIRCDVVTQRNVSQGADR